MTSKTYKDGFKYKCKTYDTPSPCSDEVEQSLNELGKDGWEICGVHVEKSTQGDGRDFEYRVFVWFKQRTLH
jgi:hypothetical protein